MCLLKDKGFHPHNRPLTAKEDIICYKKLRQIEENVYVTPCTYIQVPIECIRDKVPFKAQILSKFKFVWRHILGFSNCVEDGFIHAYQEDNGWRIFEVFKCMIPKGTKYFIGYGGEYASERIFIYSASPSAFKISASFSASDNIIDTSLSVVLRPNGRYFPY